MVAWLFAVNLAFGFLGLGLCVWHGWGDRERVVLLATLTSYGVILEQLVILRFDRYVYNVSDFLLTLGDVPVVIGFGWAAIIYAGMIIAESLGLSARARPFFVGVFALHIDLAIDAIAIRVPFWSWTPPGVWFGVPLGNFLGWFLVATLFVAAWLWVRPWIGSSIVRALLSLGLALVGVVAGLEVWEAVATTLPRQILVLSGVVLIGIVIVLLDWRESERGEVEGLDWRPASIPFLFHGSYLGYFLVLGMFAETPVLLVVSLAMVGLSVGLHAQLSIRLPRRSNGWG